VAVERSIRPLRVKRASVAFNVCTRAEKSTWLMPASVVMFQLPGVTKYNMFSAADTDSPPLTVRNSSGGLSSPNERRRRAPQTGDTGARNLIFRK